MTAVTPDTLSVHASQLPDAVRTRLLAGLAEGQLPARFLYDSLAQATRWLQVHEVHSPARTQQDVMAMYESLFHEGRAPSATHVLSLGSGGGQKDRVLLDAMGFGTWEGPAVYLPLDTSPTLALLSAQVCASPGRTLRPWIADLEVELNRTALGIEPDARLAVFAFGLTPNFESKRFFALLQSLLRPGDPAYVSVNTSAEPHRPDAESIGRIEAQYDNAETREWMAGALAELGLDRDRFGLRFRSVPTHPAGSTWQIRATADLQGPVGLNVLGEPVTLPRQLQVFFSNRVWTHHLQGWVEEHGFVCRSQVVAPSGEEAVLEITPR